MLQYTARITSQDTPRVGGRNLIKNGDKEKGTIGSYVAYYLHTPIDKAEPFTLSFDVLSVDRPPIGDSFLVLFMYKTRFQTSSYIKYEEGRVRYSCIIDTQDRESYDKGFKANRVYIYPNNSNYAPDRPDVGGFTIANVKLERGSIATDWTPAPEDVAESVSTVNTNLTNLANTLLDHNTGEIHKLETLLGKHKEDTDKNFEDLATHPLTIDKDGYWQIWNVKERKYVTTQYQSRGQQGEPGHNPSPEDVLDTQHFRDLLGGEVTEQIQPVATDLGRAAEEAISKAHESLAVAENANQHIDLVSQDLANEKHKITNLESVSLTPQQHLDFGYLTDSLQVLRSAGNTLEGLALQRLIALSGNGTDISAYLASNALGAVLKAGITGFGTPQEREQVAICHNGTGHIGNLYFTGNQIDFRTDEHTDPYLSIGAEEATFIETFLKQARLDDTPVAVGSVTLTTSTTNYERTVDVANDGTRLTVSISDLNVATYVGATTRLTLDGEVLAEWQGVQSLEETWEGGLNGTPRYKDRYSPYTDGNLSYERVVKAGRHTIKLEIVNPNNGATATINGLKVRRRYDTGAQQSALTKSGLRLFGSPDRYLDVDYRQHYTPNGGQYTVVNPYLVRIKGGAKIDKLTADELDVPGVPLCGATFDEGGGQINSFGAKAKQQGYSYAQAYRAYNADFYRVYHSIGHTNYIPVLQVYGLSNGNYTQCLTTRIDAIEANSFAVRIVTTGNVSIKHSFSYVAFKTTV